MCRERRGTLTRLKSFDLRNPGPLPAAGSIEHEQALLDQGLLLLVKISSRGCWITTEPPAPFWRRIVRWRRMLSTPASAGRVLTGLSCAQAIVASGEHFCAQFHDSGNRYLQERVLDVRDVCFQLLQHIYGESRFPAPGKLTVPAICLADELTPSQFLELDKTLLQGLLLSGGGTTSHTVILARSFNIPTLVGVEMAALLPWVGQPLFIDGNAGLVVVNPDEAVERYYQQEAGPRRSYVVNSRRGLIKTGSQRWPASGGGGQYCPPVEAAAAFGNGAQAVGLFRTEMLYMDRPGAPSEDELYNIFFAALEPANGRSIIIRTMDIGGDKPVAYLNIPAENNPSWLSRGANLRGVPDAVPHAAQGDSARLGARFVENYDSDDLLDGRDSVGERSAGRSRNPCAMNIFRSMRRSRLASCWKCHR